MPWWAYAASTIAPVGLPAAGVEKDPVIAGSRDTRSLYCQASPAEVVRFGAELSGSSQIG